MKAAVYTRVSTAEQTALNQEPVLVQWASSRGFTLAGIYTEADTAWRAGHQKELARLVDDARRRPPAPLRPGPGLVPGPFIPRGTAGNPNPD